MSIGPFQHLQSSHEFGSGNGLPCEPWLLPISDKFPEATSTADELTLAVRRAARPFWLAANALCIALGLLVTVQATTGWMAPANPKLGAVASAEPPTLPAQNAALTEDH